MELEPIELILSRAELVYVLNALQVRRIVGVELEEFGWPEDKFARLIQKAEQTLISRSLLTIDPETQTRLLVPELVGMVGTLAFRSVAFVLIRGVRDKGQQLFVYNLHKEAVVEHTLPRDGVHRLAHIGTPKDLFSRIESLAPLELVRREGRPQFTIEQREFESVRKNVQSNGSVKIATSVLAGAGLGKDLIPVFIQSLKNPLLTLSLAYLECEDDTITAASSVAVFADEQSSWGIWSGAVDVNPSELLIFPTGINDLKSAFTDWLGPDY